MLRLSRRYWAALAAAAWIVAAGAWLLSSRPTALVDSYAKCADEGYPVTDTDPPVCRAFGQVFVGPRASPSPDPSGSGDTTGSATTSLPFDILVDGDSHGDYPVRQEVITTDTAWQSYWQAIHAGIHPVPPLLPVDFTKNQVIALSEGQKPTGGYSLRVNGVTDIGKGTVVDMTETIPTITCMVTQSFSNRYLIVRTPKLTPPVSFRITTDHHRCQ